MKGRTLGMILLLVGSIVLGLIAGELNLVTAKGAAFTYGLLTGVALFLWGLIVALVSPAFRRKGKQGH